jgi:hypothetical protein
MKKTTVVFLLTGIIIMACVVVASVDAKRMMSYWETKSDVMKAKNNTNITTNTWSGKVSKNNMMTGNVIAVDWAQRLNEKRESSGNEKRAVTSYKPKAAKIKPRAVVGQGFFINGTNSTKYSCTDSDGGRVYTVKGHVFGATPRGQYDNWDVCSTPTRVKEWYCTFSQEPVFVLQNCKSNTTNSTTCVDGRCIQ